MFKFMLKTGMCAYRAVKFGATAIGYGYDSVRRQLYTCEGTNLTFGDIMECDRVTMAIVARQLYTQDTEVNNIRAYLCFKNLRAIEDEALCNNKTLHQKYIHDVIRRYHELHPFQVLANPPMTSDLVEFFCEIHEQEMDLIH